MNDIIRNIIIVYISMVSIVALILFINDEDNSFYLAIVWPLALIKKCYKALIDL